MSNETTAYVNSAPIAELEIGTLCNYILLDSIRAGSSDIHIEPFDSTLVVRIRVNGKLRVLDHLPLELAEKISGRFKVICNLSTYEKGMPLDGRAAVSPEMGRVTLRVSIFPLTEGEKIVIRIFDPSSRTFDLEKLGFEPEVRDQFINLLKKTSGLLLLTGPTGSGKTTAIYAALSWLLEQHGSEISISTVEDPMEIPLEMVSQAQLNVQAGFTYPVAMRSLLRQDPQVIMIGEIRDADTASIAVQASLTGHLVISTIHSGTTAGVYARLFNMGIEPFLLCSSIIGVLGTRLLRQNCPYCSIPYEPEPNFLDRLSAEVIEEAQFRRGDGCDQCEFSGFTGRRGIVELLTPTEPFREAVMEKKPNRVLQQMAMDAGMTSLWEQGMKRVLAGDTTFEEVINAVSEDQM
ncbi:MAG: GspE/PulE family protein [Verrucomicrobiia bacterium]|jgi:type II secretory ATPase GspE/PulE/Tfp pilus assembly ATPase PilB-like protein